MRHPLPARAAALCAVLALAAACAESPSESGKAPAPLEPGSPGAVRLVCRADVRQGTVRCAEPGAAGLRADRIMGQGTGMKLTSGNIAIVADTFAFDLAVTNGLSYPVGTSDGVNADPNGIRVFVVDGIHTTAGSGSVAVANADGTGAFTATGQPYFAYPGILQPDATSPARRWKFRFDAGVEQFTFGMYLSVPVPPGGGGVWMTVLLPAKNAVVGDSAVVRVRIDSASASVASVHASAAGRRVRLLPVSPGVVQAALPLAGLPAQALELVVDAGTIRGDTGRVTVPITKDAPPRVTVTAPAMYYVASPELRIDADCVDDDPAGCASITATARAGLGSANPTRTLATGTTGIHATVDLSTSHEEQMPTLRVTGYDSRGAASEVRMDVFVETEPSLVRVDSAASLAMDLDSTRLLFADTMARVWIRQRADGARTLVSDVPGGTGSLVDAMSGTYGFLHPQGAIFVSGRTFGTVYDWRGATPLTLGNADSRSSLAVAGNWAIWSSGTTLSRRDLAAGTNVTVSTGAINWRNGVAPNGDVAFSGPGREIYRYRAGVTTPLTADLDSAHWNLYPQTDGTHVLFFKSDQHGLGTLQPGRVALWDGGETILSTVPGTYFAPRDYAANGGWIAYTVVDGGGVTQVRTRAPDGTDRLATSSGSSSTIRALAADGTLVYGSNGATYVVRAPYSGAPTRLGGDWFRASFQYGELYLFLGNSVFKAIY